MVSANAAMGTLTDINKLVAMLRTIEEEERKQFDLVQKIHEELVRKTLEDALNPGKIPANLKGKCPHLVNV